MITLAATVQSPLRRSIARAAAAWIVVTFLIAPLQVASRVRGPHIALAQGHRPSDASSSCRHHAGACSGVSQAKDFETAAASGVISAYVGSTGHNRPRLRVVLQTLPLTTREDLLSVALSPQLSSLLA